MPLAVVVMVGAVVYPAGSADGRERGGQGVGQSVVCGTQRCHKRRGSQTALKFGGRMVLRGGHPAFGALTLRGGTRLVTRQMCGCWPSV